MRLTVLLLALVALMGLLPAKADATAYRVVDGYKVYDGYPGLYWYGSYAHTRVWTVTPGYYDSYGRYVQPYGTWRYVYSHTYTTPTYTAPITYQTPNAQALLIGLRKDMLAQENFNQTVKVLGLQGHPGVSAYGQPGYTSHGGGYSGTLTLSSAGTQGSTVYGYSANGLANIGSIYGDTNIATLYQQAMRLAENSQKLSGQATGDFTALVGADAAGRARVAEIIAKAQGLALIQRSLEGTATTKNTAQLTFKPAEQPAPPMPQAQGEKEEQAAPQVQGQAQYRAALGASIQRNCASCHGPQSQKAGGLLLTLESYLAMDADSRLRVIGRLTTHDQKKLMPRTDDNGPGTRLGFEEIRLYMQ